MRIDGCGMVAWTFFQLLDTIICNFSAGLAQDMRKLRVSYAKGMDGVGKGSRL